VSLSIELYDHNETLGRCDLSYAEMSAFSTTTFALMGYPVRVADERELAGFVDWNFSTSNLQYFIRDYFVSGPGVRTVFSPDERDALRRLGDRVAAMTRDRYGRPMRPISSLLAQMGLYRALLGMKAATGLEELSVFEVGPGNGYLGALLIDAGCRYAATDNAQSLYLWQSRLFEACAGDGFREWAETGAPERPGERPVHHLPWWEYVRLRHRSDLRADVVVSNTNLGEMNYGALLYTARYARRILEGSPLGLLVFTNIGDAKQNSMATVDGELARAGFKRVCHRLFHAYAAVGAETSEAVLALDEDIPLHNPTGSPERFTTLDVLDLSPAMWPSDLDFISYLGVFTPPSAMLDP